ncbi:MAG: hydantoinase B/oxoprolinase family protein [Woeseiaceae bacterium]|nr:hydantoinase B/oxoprolinase family protein [Woeseiaceae bacterium]
MTPILRRYVASLVDALDGVCRPRRLMFMQSNGGLIEAQRFRGKDSILSGPAGGVVGMARAAASVGLDRLVGFDMGGTSTDVTAFDGDYERSSDNEIAGVRLRAPMMRIHTIAAGGGSLLRFADGRYQVGPDSAGADPGPACYRRGGPLTVTDANLVLGRLVAEFFPRVFGPNADLPLDERAARRGFESLAADIAKATGDMPCIEHIAEGFLAVANANMANAIRKMTIERGEDARDYTLCCFGGAAGQHACRVADSLGMTRIWLHPLAGVLSAYGMGLADRRVERRRSVEKPLSDEVLDELKRDVDSLEQAVRAELEAQSLPAGQRGLAVRLGVRLSGTETAFDVDFADAASVAAAFAKAWQERFGARLESGPVEIATVAVVGTGYEQRFDEPALAVDAGGEPDTLRSMWLDGNRKEVPVWRRERLGATATIDGPAILIEDNATTVVDPGWRGTVGDTGHLLLVRREPRTSAGTEPPVDEDGPDPVRLEIFNRLFMHIAEQMGVVLQNTALSVNIRERLDFSCALFDAQGRLVSNAPHMPVHLGSMGESVRSVIRARGTELTEGDAIMLNSPYNGGTHLPDITVVTPWFGTNGQGTPMFFLASRAHHADVGGLTPGSMPARSRHIDDEGVLIDNEFLVRHGRFQDDAVRELLSGAKYPARNVEQNLADLRAQLAANRQGIRQLEKAIERHGEVVVQRYLRFVRDNAAVSVRRLIERLTDGEFDYELDSGEHIRVAIRLDRRARRARIDFEGTSPQSESNFNAPEAVTRAAVLYVFRSLIDEDIPMNEGCLEPLDVVIPEGSLLSPGYPAAVVAGNVETSQCVTDALYGALGALAAAQGTMNNLSFGNDGFQYYETIAGGAGAGPGFHGADAVQTHMTNSRLTDPEVLESRMPVRLQDFRIRFASGGAGRWHGGNGTVRRLKFLEAAELSILSGHRRVPPFGLAGGRPGKTGRNTLIRASGERQSLEATAQASVAAAPALATRPPAGGASANTQNGRGDCSPRPCAQSAFDDPQHDAAVLRLARRRGIVGDRPALAVSQGGQAIGLDAARDQVVAHGLGSALRKRFVVPRIAIAVGMSLDGDHDVRIAAQRCCGLIEHVLGARQQPVRVGLEVHARQIDCLADLAAVHVDFDAGAGVRAAIEAIDDPVAVAVHFAAAPVDGGAGKRARAFVDVIRHAIGVVV